MTNNQKLNELEKSVLSLKEENSNLLNQLLQADELNKLRLKKLGDELELLRVEVFEDNYLLFFGL
jgi:hypothetical protein